MQFSLLLDILYESIQIYIQINNHIDVLESILADYLLTESLAHNINSVSVVIFPMITTATWNKLLDVLTAVNITTICRTQEDNTNKSVLTKSNDTFTAVVIPILI